jgi:hypothetical protein
MVFFLDDFHCLRSDEIPTSVVNIRLARIEHVPSKERHSVLLDLQFLENVDVLWSANLHLKVLTLVRAIKAFTQELKEKRLSPSSSVTEKKNAKALDWRVSFKSETNVDLMLSSENNMLFSTGKFICFNKTRTQNYTTSYAKRGFEYYHIQIYFLCRSIWECSIVLLSPLILIYSSYKRH